jgi:pimeloyl-ACP methyl ester carboxylesterase
MNALLSRLAVREVDWVGTSLGGLIGIVMAGFPGNMVRKLVINDIGPFVSATGLRRIGEYIAAMPASFPTIEDGEEYYRSVLAPYGHLSDEHWRQLTIHSLQWDDLNRHYRVLCDPAITKAFTAPWFYTSLNLWSYWEAIAVPMLILHGAKSDLLSSGLTMEMKRRNERAGLFRFDHCGHVPPLMAPDQIAVVSNFLRG